MSRAGMLTIDLSSVLDKISAEQRTLRDKADEITAKVITEDRDFTKDEEASLKEAQDKIVALGKRSEAIRKQAEVRGGLEQPGSPRTGPEARPKAGGAGKGDDEDDEQRERIKKYDIAFRAWVRRGPQSLSDEQRESLQAGFTMLPAEHPETRDLSAVTGNLGGYTVPQGFVDKVDVAMKSFDGVRQAPTGRLSTGQGNDLPWPTVNDTAQTGELLAENAATASQDVAFGQVTFKAYLYSSKAILVPIQLLQDTGVDIEGLLARIAGERLGRITNTHFTTGDNSSKPQGIVTASVLGKTAAAAAAITYDELVDLQHSVDPAYRGPTAGWMFNDTTLGVLRKLKDSDGRPIWQPAMTSGMADGAPGMLLGYKYFINQAMASPATTAKSVIFGDLSKYVIRDVKNLTLVRLTERYAEKFQVGFFAFLRADGRAVDAGTNPIKHLVHP